MTWTPINFEPGVYKDDSPLKAQGYYIDADKIRFVNGLPETIYGWERASTSSLLGLCRGAFTWQDNSRSVYAAFGTHLRLYAMDQDGAVTDITPATAYSLPSMSLATTNASAVVTVTSWTHGLSVDQKFKIENPSTTTIGGVTVAGTYVVLTVESATSITFTAAQTATSTAGPTSITADVTTYLAPGQEDGLAGQGFGTGGYGSGGYGGGSTGLTLFPRTWSFDQWGQNLLSSPRGDGLYEWAPNTSASELLTNGGFSTGAGGWSTGAGWTIGSGVATSTAGTGSDLEQNVTLSAGAWHLLAFNLTVLAGSMYATWNSSTVRAGITANGNYRVPFFSGAGGTAKLKFIADSSFGGVMRNASLKVLTTAQLVTGAPTMIGSMFVTAERIVVACGSNLDGAFDPLQVDWSDAEDNQDWTATSSNLAGGYTLPSGGRVVRGLPGPRENLLWTTESLWAMRYNANPGTVYDFIEMGRGCGLIGPNAAAIAGGTAYWMSPEGAFFAYSGAAPQMIPSTLARDVFDNLAWVQGDKVYASHVIGKNYSEIWWFIPDSRDGDEVSRYVIFDTINGTWSCGTFDRTAYVHGAVFQYPLAVDTDGAIWFHEKDFTEDGAPRSWSLTSSFANQPGNTLIINGVRPDTDDLQGGYTMTFESKARDSRGIFTRTHPALSITAATGKKNIRVKGEQVGFTVAGNAAPTFWRQGALQMDILINTGSR
jgi:hypothetical protein